jgi:thiamine-phosphate pyrophosphorylase
MKHRVYTLPDFFEGEADLLNQLFEEGLPCLHFRKRQQSIHPFIDLLVKIERKHYSKIIVHQYPELVEMFNLSGLHLTESARRKLSTKALQDLISEQHKNQRQIGTSIHQKKDLDRLPKEMDYCTLSPVFSSISKQNHEPTVNWKTQKLDVPFSLVALGGISVQTLDATYHQRGFREVAFLGAVWNDLSNVLQNYRLLCKKMNALTL